MSHLSGSLVDILRKRGKEQPRQLAYRFLIDGEYEEVLMTYEDLDRRARSIAALLQSSVTAGERALLIFAPGLDFIAAFFGCLYAKVLAIPAYPLHPARPERNLPVILRIASDAKPAVALLTSSLLDVIKSRKEISAAFGKIKLLATDNNGIDSCADNWMQLEIGSGDIAFLQYTSGSTTIPKGVMVSHGNLINNLGFIEESFGLTNKSSTVFWLPPYHDMGLGGILQSLYTGYPATLIPHLMFLQRPFRWLQAISRFRATCSGGPNFAYDLCTRKVKPEQREQIDLSSWGVAFNGAEPIYYKSLDQFADFFAPCGFNKEAFLPCYGLAEATLMVAGAPKTRTPLIKNLINSRLEQNQVAFFPEKREDTRTLVSCGQNKPDHKIRIVNTQTLMPCHTNEVGEIWVRGPGVAKGYWNKVSETASTFGAMLTDDKDGPFLRTGDLGFMHEGELYITGRLKNLIICGGKNHYPHDIERTVESAHPAIRQAGSAVFSICKSGSEQIIIIVELEQKLVLKTEEVIKAIRHSVSINHELHVNDIIITNAGGIPKTTSGKIRHFLCKEYYLDGVFNEIKLT